MFDVILFLVLLQVKHWYIDFVDQSDIEVQSKGIYGDWPGIMHSLKHAAGTLLATIIAFDLLYLGIAVALSVIDFLLHYHIDWAKMNFGNRDITTKAFWVHLGLDQMLHQMTYILFLTMAVL